MGDYLRWVERTTGKTFSTYAELWAWSVEDVARFWLSIAWYFEVHFYGRPAIPHTWSGKKLEVPVKRLLVGVAYGRAVQEGTFADPAARAALLAAVGGRFASVG